MESFEDLTKKIARNNDALSSQKTPTDQQTSVPAGDVAGSENKQSLPGKTPDRDQAHQRPSNDLTKSLVPADVPLYPQLSHNPPESERDAANSKASDGEDDEITMPVSFDRPPDLTIAAQRMHAAHIGQVGSEGVVRMHKFVLYETASYFYILGSDLLESSYRILKIDRTAEDGELNVAEDDIVYTKLETHRILNAIDEGNQATGGLKLKAIFWGLLGFIRFTGPYYMIYVTKRSHVAMIGGHYLYQIDGTELVPLTAVGYGRARPDRNAEESRFLNILNNVDLTRSYYFSYSYDITRTLQHNITRERQALQQGLAEPLNYDHNDMFVWNHHLLEAAKAALRKPFDWCLSLIHGYVDQSALSVYWGRVVYVTIIARRSRFFAGARYLKRGANDLGYVANDVETEQIVSEMLTTSFHAPGPALFANPNYTSYVQHRGSIPLYWTQESTKVTPKPDIHLNVIDPFYSAAAMHFDNLFQRYGAPVYVLNLVKARERTPRESKLLHEYTKAVAYLNQFLPEDKKIIYRAWDMSRASKTSDQDVIGSLEAIAEDILPKTGFFRNGNDATSGLKLQSGVARTNCIDCLDRTNAAQFVIAKKAFGYQLQALGVIEDPSVEYDSDAINLFTHMWHDHGDTIAVQYGGSHLVNTMATYRKINQWTSHSRDMVESFRRYYNNAMMDGQRQEAYNLFLGNYVFAQGQPMLWDLATDYYLHHSDPRSIFERKRPNYRNWYTPAFLEPTACPPTTWPPALAAKPLEYFDDFWVEYYRPLALSSFKKIFSFKMHSNLRYIPIRSTQEGKYDLSPFRVREDDTHSQKRPDSSRKKGVTILAPSEQSSTDVATATTDEKVLSPTAPAPKPATLGPWLDAQQRLHATSRRATAAGGGIIKESPLDNTISQPPMTVNLQSKNPTKAELSLNIFTKMVENSLNPSVPYADEYERYVQHPQNISLVTIEPDPAALSPVSVYAVDMFSAEAESTSAAPSSLSNSKLKIPPEFQAYLAKPSEEGMLQMEEQAQASGEAYTEFLHRWPQEGLTVLEEDNESKRYKAYRQWLRGKSLFKQREVVDGFA